MRDVRRRIIRTLVAVCTAVLMTGCLQDQDTVIEGDTDVDIVPATPPVDPDKVVCDPFAGGNQQERRTQGVAARLAYVEPDKPTCTNMAQCLSLATPIDVDLFFSDINIPTRPFDRGFTTQSGTVIQTPQGNTLYEYFTVSFRGQVHLGPDQTAGNYQLGILADDGAVMRMKSAAGTMDLIVNNDGTHPTRLACASEPVALTAGGKIPFELDYYQGPRFHIALVVMWRPWPADNNPNDPLCGQQGNSLFFDSTQNPPAPRPAYNQLLSRGWRPLSADNYSLPQEDGDPTENPCNAPAPVISNFRIDVVTTTSATLSWRTDIPASSQVAWTNPATGQSGQSAADANLKTAHSVTVTGLTANTLYSMKAVSASSSGRSSESAPLSVRTRR